MYRKFLGSTIALAVGIFCLFAIFAPPDQGQSLDTFRTGLIFILGSLAYKSVKKRKMGIVKNSKVRKYVEAVELVIVFILALFLKYHISAFIYLVWIVSAYLIVATRVMQAQSPHEQKNPVA